MGAENLVQAAPRPRAGPRRSVAAPKNRERAFWLWVACAAALHAAIILGVTRSLPRQMGERDGSKDAITVDLVDAADFASRTAPPVRQAASPPGSGEAQQRPQPATEAASPSAPAPRQKKPPEPSIDKEALSLLSPPENPNDAKEKQSATGSAAKSKPAPQQPKSSMQLDLPDLSMPPLGRSAAVSRPPGVTRSGENDEFGRGVIRALRRTMPTSPGMLGRVTVRLLLSDTGNLTEVRLIRSAGDPHLDQSVVFAVKQSSFPIPPAGSTLGDRTFLVTYIYN